MKLIFIYLVVQFFISSLFAAKKSAETHLLWLKNDAIEVGILKEVGARIVVLRKPGGINLFKSNPSQWESAKEQKPEVNAFANFEAYNGHIGLGGATKRVVGKPRY